MAKKQEQQKNDDALGSLLVETGVTMASLILFPAILQRLRVSPMVMSAVKTALTK